MKMQLNLLNHVINQDKKHFFHFDYGQLGSNCFVVAYEKCQKVRCGGTKYNYGNSQTEGNLGG